MVLKTPKIAREPFCSRNSAQEHWWRVFQRATVTDGAWDHAQPQMETKTSGSGTSSSSLLVVTPTVSCTRSKKTHNHNKKAVGFNLFFLVSDLFLIPFLVMVCSGDRSGTVVVCSCWSCGGERERLSGRRR
jgi:hypothetical protein